jgi:hypothetical protein
MAQAVDDGFDTLPEGYTVRKPDAGWQNLRPANKAPVVQSDDGSDTLPAVYKVRAPNPQSAAPPMIAQEPRIAMHSDLVGRLVLLPPLVCRRLWWAV